MTFVCHKMRQWNLVSYYGYYAAEYTRKSSRDPRLVLALAIFPVLGA